MLLNIRHPLARWAAALASAAVVAAGSLAIAPAASAVPRYTNQLVWTAPSVTVPYGTAITAAAGDGRLTLTPQTYSAGTWTPGTPVAYSASVVAQAYDGTGTAVNMASITLPTATCGLYATTDTGQAHPRTGTIPGPANYVTYCTADGTVAGYTNVSIAGKGVVQGEATLSTRYTGPTSIDAVTAFGAYPSVLGYTSVKKNSVAAAAPLATCGLYAAADTTYTGTNYAGLTAPVGSYNAHCAYNADPLWSTTYNGDVALTVVGTPTTTTVNCPTNVTYNGSAQTPCTATVTGNGLNLSVTPTYTNNTNAGTATASYSYAGDTLYAPSSGSANFTIDPNASSTVVTCPASVSYNGQAQTPCSVAVTATDGLSLNFALTDPTAYSSNTNTGTASVSYTWPGDANHTSSTGTATFQIHAASTTTVTCPASVIYTGTAQTPCTVTVTDGGALNLTFDANYSANTNVGTATASYSWPGDATHDPSSGSATFAITPAASTVTVNCPASVVYNGSAQTPCSVTITAPGISTTATPTYTNNTNVGTATASYTYAGTANVNGSTGSATFAITKASVTITASSPAAITYGANVPAITYTSSVPALTWNPAITCAVYASGDTAFATALTGVQNAGTYVTHCANGVNANYTPTYVDGSLTINKSATAVTVTASSPAAITYGTAVPAVTSTTPTGGWTTAPTCGVYANAASNTALTGVQNAGTYVTKCAGGVALNYSNITYVNGSLVINKAPVVITAQSRTGTRGGAIPTPTFTSNPTAATYTTQPICRVYNTSDTTFATPLTGNFPNAAGTYVTHCSGAVSTNYTPSYVNGTITVA